MDSGSANDVHGESKKSNGDAWNMKRDRNKSHTVIGSTDPDYDPKSDHPPLCRYVEFTRQRCQQCGSVDVENYKTIEKTDENWSMYSRCRDCSARFISMFT